MGFSTCHTPPSTSPRGGRRVQPLRCGREMIPNIPVSDRLTSIHPLTLDWISCTNWTLAHVIPMDLPGSSPGLVAKSLSLFRLSLVESHTQLLRQLDQKIRELEKAEGQGQWRLWLEGEVVRDKVFVYANERVAAVQKKNVDRLIFGEYVDSECTLFNPLWCIKAHKQTEGRYMRQTEAMSHLEVHGIGWMVGIIRIHELGFFFIFPKMIRD